MSPDVLLYTIGHSDHAPEAFVDLLRQHDVTLVVDVRSQPYSRWTPQFNREVLQRDLADSDIDYQFMGDALGGRPPDPALYTGDQPNYEQMASRPAYQTGIETLIALARAERLAVMCSEGTHDHCHRHLLITQTLLKQGVRVLHIQPDGATIEAERIARQLSLF